ncbi:hypothetical protein D3C86_1682810 [compost metagenome]
MAHFLWLNFLTADKAGHLHHDTYQHDGPRLGSFARQRHNASEDPFAALAGDDFIHVGNVGVDIPRHIVDTAATEASHRRHQQQQRVNVAQPGVIEHCVGNGSQTEQHHHHPIGRSRSKADTQWNHGDHRDELENSHRSQQVGGH